MRCRAGTFQGFAVALLGLIDTSSRLAAQGTRTDTTPEAVVAASFRALRDEDWKLLLALTHRRGLERFRRDMIEKMSQRHSLRAGVRARGPADQLLLVVFGVVSIEELEALPPDTLLVRVLAYTREAYNRSTAYEHRDWQPEILGHVLDGDSIAYVMIRKSVSLSARPVGSDAGTPTDVDESDELVDFVTLRRDARRRWCTMLNGGLFYNRNGFGFVDP